METWPISTKNWWKVRA